MSRQPATPAGFFGKLPSRGDFVSRNLPPPFVRAWDAWVSACLADGRRSFGDDFLHRYLLAPVWRFALAPGLAGSNGWIGVLATSIDAVGRCFPLTLAAELPDGVALNRLTGEASRPLSDLAQVALRMIDGHLSPETAGDEIGRIAAVVVSEASMPIRRETIGGDQVVGWATRGAPHASIAVRLTMTARVVEPGARSVWWHDGWGGAPAETIVFAGLPEPASFRWLLAPGDADVRAAREPVAAP
jgi:type VI secretion system protein ImpM